MTHHRPHIPHIPDSSGEEIMMMEHWPSSVRSAVPRGKKEEA
jgi:hypothetical protein